MILAILTFALPPPDAVENMENGKMGVLAEEAVVR